jgi:hypothetical protein
MDARDVLTSRCTAREKRTKLACAACGARNRAARASHRLYARMRVSMTTKKLFASRGGASRACARVYRANSRARARHITSRVESATQVLYYFVVRTFEGTFIPSYFVRKYLLPSKVRRYLRYESTSFILRIKSVVWHTLVNNSRGIVASTLKFHSIQWNARATSLPFILSPRARHDRGAVPRRGANAGVQPCDAVFSAS